jgi:hypothetical protein
MYVLVYALPAIYTSTSTQSTNQRMLLLVYVVVRPAMHYLLSHIPTRGQLPSFRWCMMVYALPTLHTYSHPQDMLPAGWLYGWLCLLVYVRPALATPTTTGMSNQRSASC